MMNQNLCANCEVAVADLSTPAGLGQARTLILGVKPVLTVDVAVAPCCEFAAESAARLKEDMAD